MPRLACLSLPLALLACRVPDYVEVTGGRSESELSFDKSSQDRLDGEEYGLFLTAGWDWGERREVRNRASEQDQFWAEAWARGLYPPVGPVTEGPSEPLPDPEPEPESEPEEEPHVLLTPEMIAAQVMAAIAAVWGILVKLGIVGLPWGRRRKDVEGDS